MSWSAPDNGSRPAAAAGAVPLIRHFRQRGWRFAWTETDTLAYKEEGAHFRGVTRQVLFGAEQGSPSELRYFEIAPGGHSTLERHEHIHGVLILRGRGRVLVGETIHRIGAYDAVYVPSMTWHQFRAGPRQPLGFLCLVDAQRDRPQRPSPGDLCVLRRNSRLDSFIRV